MSEEWSILADVGVDLGFCEDGPSLTCECGADVGVEIDGEPGTCNSCGRRYTVETVVKVAPALPDWKRKEYPVGDSLTACHVSDLLAYFAAPGFVFPEFCEGETESVNA